jgi:creatinine amidohydrolase
MDIFDATWTDADATETLLAVLPVGSTEQHGPHAPLGTDVITAEAVASAGVDRYDGTAVVAPAIPVGIAAEHRQFTGSLWVTEDTFRAYVSETVESLASHGWDRVVVVNGHGGNIDALRELCGTLTREETAYAVPFTWFNAVDLAALGTAMGHGGPAETSLVRHARPALVATDRLDAAAADAADGWGDWQSGTNLAYDSAEFTDNGVVGDPSESSAELGEQLLDAAADALAELLDTVESRDVSRPPHR